MKITVKDLSETVHAIYWQAPHGWVRTNWSNN